MDLLLEKLGFVVWESGQHRILLVSWNCVKHLIKKWSRNRPADECRVVEIVDFIRNGGFVAPPSSCGICRGGGSCLLRR